MLFIAVQLAAVLIGIAAVLIAILGILNALGIGPTRPRLVFSSAQRAIKISVVLASIFYVMLWLGI